MTRQEAEQKALQDYQAALGTVITVQFLSGYRGDDSADLDGIPVQVKVLATDKDSILHWNDDWLDPYWDVEPVERLPEIEGMRSFWAYGPSYQVPQARTQEAPHAR